MIIERHGLRPETFTDLTGDQVTEKVAEVMRDPKVKKVTIRVKHTGMTATPDKHAPLSAFTDGSTWTPKKKSKRKKKR